MKQVISTSVEQSRRLLACGVDPKTADMSVRTIKEPFGEDMAWHIPKLLTLPYEEAKTIYGNDEIEPAWSLSALSEIVKSLIPKDVTIGIDCKDNEWIACVEWFQYEAHLKKHFKAEHLIDVFLNMNEWFAKSGYSLNKIEE